jgi:hypothetical protein
MTAEETTQQNAYLKLRNAQLQADVTALAAEAERLRQVIERFHGRAVARQAPPENGDRPT